jgi:hypothetical protein
VAVVAAAFASGASAGGTYCSPSGDVCVGVIEKPRGVVLLEISTAAQYFNRYRVCVRGPKSRVCRVFAVRKTAAGGTGSRISWRRNFPNQGRGLYRVTWQYSAKTLTFRR